MRRLAMLSAGLVAAGGLAILTTPSPASAAGGVFTNNANIAIPDNSTVTSTVAVAGTGGAITDVDVKLSGLSHTFGSDLDIWLISPDKVAVPLMSDICSSGGIGNATLTFSDEAAAPLPSAGCGTGTYKPSNAVLGGDVVPSGAVTVGAALSAFDGHNANGSWQLSVTDDTTSDTGQITGGFTVTITTGPAAVLIPNAGAATPYPYPINVTTQPGRITDVDVSLIGLSHSYPDDLDILLVNPAGKGVVLTSGACGTTDVNRINWRFDDAAAAGLPDSPPAGTSCPSGAFKPGDLGAAVVMPPPAPGGPYGATLASLNGTAANGTWKLYVRDSAGPDGGFITSVKLAIKTDAPPNTVITRKPRRTTTSHRAVIGFRSTESPAKFQCKVDAKAWKACRTPLRLTRLTKGRHVVRVRAIDAEGHKDPTPAIVRWRIL